MTADLIPRICCHCCHCRHSCHCCHSCHCRHSCHRDADFNQLYCPSYAANSHVRMACNRFCISEWYSFDLPSYARLKSPFCGSYCFGYVICIIPPLVCLQPRKQKAPYVTGYRYTPKAALDRVRVSQFFWYVQYSLVRRLEAFQARQILSCRINCSACTFRNLFKNTESSPIYSLCIINSF